jgi:hypothetical protein
MRASARLAALAALFASLVVTPGAFAQEPEEEQEAEAPDRTLAFVAGMATAFAGFTLGGTMIATGGDDPAKTNAGWLVIQSGYALAPFTSHAVNGEWARGALFAALPTACIGGTVPVLLGQPNGAVDHGSIEEQRIMWSFFGVGLLASAVGVIDAVLPRHPSPHALRVVPDVGAKHAGVFLGGVL